MNSSFEKMKVLAVDDNRTNLHILQVFLKKLGHEVILADNGAVAVDRFIKEEPDLVLLDIMMPVMDGFEAARRIKALGQAKWTPIIFLSALNRDENLVEGLEAGADDYLTKPINFVVLEAKLRSMQRSLAMQQTAINALERLQAVSDNVLDAIITCDETGGIVTVNRAAERIFGWPVDDMVGQNISKLMPSPFAGKHGVHFASYVAGERGALLGQEREGLGHHRNGHSFPVTVGVSEVSLDGKRLFVGIIRDISERKQAERKLRENADLLQAYFDRTQSEQHLALRLMEKQLHRDGLQQPGLRYKVIATEHFSGDIVAAASSPEGRFYALLADATGHGLPAAISVLPVLALFYRMTRLNRPLRDIVLEMNQQLKESMPVGHFVAATLLCLDHTLLTGEIWVGGTPEALLYDVHGQPARHFASENLPLGIVGNNQLACQPTPFHWPPGSQIILCSDGLLEAENGQGEQFGDTGLLAAVRGTTPGERFAAIDAALARHLGDQSAADDVSLMVIDCP